MAGLLLLGSAGSFTIAPMSAVVAARLSRILHDQLHDAPNPARRSRILHHRQPRLRKAPSRHSTGTPTRTLTRTRNAERAGPRGNRPFQHYSSAPSRRTNLSAPS